MFGVPFPLPTPQGRRAQQQLKIRHERWIRGLHEASTQGIEATSANLFRKECLGMQRSPKAMLLRPTNVDLPECDCHLPPMESDGRRSRPVQDRYHFFQSIYVLFPSRLITFSNSNFHESSNKIRRKHLPETHQQAHLVLDTDVHEYPASNAAKKYCGTEESHPRAPVRLTPVRRTCMTKRYTLNTIQQCYTYLNLLGGPDNLGNPFHPGCFMLPLVGDGGLGSLLETVSIKSLTLGPVGYLFVLVFLVVGWNSSRNDYIINL